MGQRIGIIAGSGEFPSLVLHEAQKSGYFSVVAGIKGEADARIQDKADEFEWIDVKDVLKLISYFKKNGINEAIFAGKIDPRVIYDKEKLENSSVWLLAQAIDKRPASIIKAVIDFMAQEGIEVKDPSAFISSCFCQEGVLTETQPSPDIKKDIVFGWEIAKAIADLDIGQTVIIKNQAIVALEGMEGTDEAIERGGRLAGEGTVVVKVSRSSQDARIDLPAVGLSTVRSLVKAKSQALCFEAGEMPFFQKDEAISLANTNKISIVVIKK
ncbi:MAG: UDP-2,3-diacylglucosamine diphosphatase LpxI [Candidatus Aminicenantes bacterium]|nr:MAG: UDP-2,3-diacylglucosamine diphosphatase LpxI [Candidatus Aminicenantes bacterium]